MTAAQLLSEAFERIRGVLGQVLEGLPPEQLSARVGPEANTVGWLVWHLTRVQDDHVAAAFGGEQVWLAGGWAERFALPFDAAETGFAMSPDEVGEVTARSAQLLMGYHEAVCARTRAYVDGLSDGELDRVVDDSYDPPVTLGARLLSVLGDDLQHAGQAAFVKGLLGS